MHEVSYLLCKKVQKYEYSTVLKEIAPCLVLILASATLLSHIWLKIFLIFKGPHFAQLFQV